MDEKDVIAEIIEGADKEERLSDVLFLCVSATLTSLSGPWFREMDLPKDGDQSPSDEFEKVLRHLGRILCPVFDPVKPEDYKAEMVEVRQQYRGIASDPQLQAEYTTRIVELLAAGELRTLEQAIKNQIWQRLARHQAGLQA